jgi:peptidoglycan/xylan/chitin deacetylase (PgdA/CDA1 family)
MAARELTLGGVPVLMYHGIAPTPPSGVDARERKYWVPSASFRRQLVQIRLVGHHVVGLADLWAARKGGCVPDSAVVLTFDDGRASDYTTAFPLLAGARARAEFFVNTATIGQPGYLTWSQVAEMQRAGMSFQSHGHDHVVLLGLSPRLLDRQLQTSKRLLEDRLGRSVDFLAAPYGLFDRRVVSAALAAGYRAVCNSRNWPAQPGRNTVNRVAIYRHTSEGQFAALLRHRPAAYLPGLARTAVAFLPKRVFLKVQPQRLGVAQATELA